MAPESELNSLLRRVDWRFALRCSDTPRLVDLSPGRHSRALSLIGADQEASEDLADVAVTGFPSAADLRHALERLRPGGELVCVWYRPRVAAPRRVKMRLDEFEFDEIRAYWPGPVFHRLPEFWLPLDCADATRHLLASRPARSPLGTAVRALWRLATRVGLLAPSCVIARAPGSAAAPAAAARGDGGHFTDPDRLLLLTGGKRSVNKVVGLAFEEGTSRPESVVKFARVAEADAFLERETRVLNQLAKDRPAVAGVPRILATGRRAGRVAVTESAIHGDPLIGRLDEVTFEGLATQVTDWLVDLAGHAEPRPAGQWWERLVGRPLASFEDDFRQSVGTETAQRARQALEQLGDLPLVPEHRDCSPWNVVLTEEGLPALLDWESAEPSGLPALDLCYFLANAAFVLDGALDSGRTRESHRRLLDPVTPHGRVAARCIDRYCSTIGLDSSDFLRLRLLAWVVHSSSDYRHLQMERATAPTAEELRSSTYLELIEDEVEILQVGARD